MPENNFFETVEKIKMPIRLLIFGLSCGLLVIIFFAAFYFPNKSVINKTQASIDDLSRRLAKIEVTVNKKKEYDERKALITIQFDEALKHLPNTEEIPALLKNITQLGSDSQLEFKLFTPQKGRSQDFYVEIPVAIEVSGNFHNVAIFFDKIGRMDRIVNILDVTMTPIKEGSTDLITKCTAITYRFKGEAEVKEDAKKKIKKK
jgi:type IV pilus assembly protein PilO